MPRRRTIFRRSDEVVITLDYSNTQAEVKGKSAKFSRVHLASQVRKVIERVVGCNCSPWLNANEKVGPHQYGYSKTRNHKDVLAINVFNCIRGGGSSGCSNRSQQYQRRLHRCGGGVLRRVRSRVWHDWSLWPGLPPCPTASGPTRVEDQARDRACEVDLSDPRGSCLLFRNTRDFTQLSV